MAISFYVFLTCGIQKLITAARTEKKEFNLEVTSLYIFDIGASVVCEVLISITN